MYSNIFKKKKQILFRREFSTELKMTSRYLFKILITELPKNDLKLVALMITIHNELTKEFLICELAEIESIFRTHEFDENSCCSFFIKSHIYQHALGARAFLDRVPFSIVSPDRKITRGFIPKAGIFLKLPDYPDCIDRHAVTREVICSSVLVNHRGKQYLPQPKYNIRYSILTREENVAFYRSQHKSAFIEVYEKLPYWFGYERIYNEAVLGMCSDSFNIKNKIQ